LVDYTRAFDLNIINFNFLSPLLGALSKEGHSILIAHGGKGGGAKNNFKLCGGATVSTKIELQVVADVGLVGLENSGKSSLVHQLVTPIHVQVPSTGNKLHILVKNFDVTVMFFQNQPCMQTLNEWFTLTRDKSLSWILLPFGWGSAQMETGMASNF
jgi:hypothetical protein